MTLEKLRFGWSGTGKAFIDYFEWMSDQIRKTRVEEMLETIANDSYVNQRSVKNITAIIEAYRSGTAGSCPRGVFCPTYYPASFLQFQEDIDNRTAAHC